MHNIRLLFVIYLITICSTICAAPYTVIKDRVQTKIKTPTYADRKTAKIRLNNGLEALIISEPSANKSGAAISVNVGSWEDPDEYPGLAHFLEHMLFLGTKKYPNESEFSNFITDHGGDTNAFTSNTTTNFLFTINNSAFDEALDRFSNFFIEPIFNPSGVSRELTAIDQEFAKNVESDNFRDYYVYKDLLNPEHPSHRFNAGNSSTLAKVSQETFKEWYKNHYSANLMKLIVYSPQPLDKLINLVVEDFSGIPTSNRASPVITIPALKPENAGKFVFIEPIKNTRSLSLTWELPTKFYDMKDTRPESSICDVLGDEGENSLLAQLKRESLAEGITCGAVRVGNKLENFSLDIELTSLGLKKIETVILRCFQAIKNLKEKGIPPYIFNEIQNISKIHYEYQSFENEFSMLMNRTQNIQDENMDTFPEQTLIPQKFSQNDIKDLLSYLTPQNVHFFITAPAIESGIAADQTEKWLSVQYAVLPIPNAMIADWNNASANPAIDLPPPNKFIPDDLTIFNGTIPEKTFRMPQPKTVIDNDYGRIYFAPDNYYKAPSISWTLQIRTPGISMADPKKIVIGDLFVKFLEDALVKFSYPAKRAGLDYKVEREKNGIKFTLNGYNQNAILLFKEFLIAAAELKPDPEKFPIFKDSLVRQYENYSKESPLDQGFEILKSVLYKDYVTEKQKAAALRGVDFESFTSTVAQLWDQTFVEGVLYGNMTEQQAKEVANLAINQFQKGIYPPDQQFQTEVLILPDNKGPYYVEYQTKVQGSAAILGVEGNKFSFKERAAQQILMQDLKELFFSALRTQQQTGYIVASLGQEIERKLFDFFAVQTNSHDVRDLLARFEAFLEKYVQDLRIKSFNEKQFNTIKQAQLDQLKRPPSNMKAMGEILSLLALDYEADFNWNAKRIEGMESLTYDEFLNIAINTLGKQNRRRIGVLLLGEMPAANYLHYIKAENTGVIEKIGVYEGRN